MAAGIYDEGIVPGRLGEEDYAENFSDLHPPFEAHEALVAADRCYFCHDAPCVTACPTTIDIPMFIRQIATGNPVGSAKTIFDQNILGGMCARVCPTETLCEEVCVRETAEGKPVEIGRLQRYATDLAMSMGRQFYSRPETSGKQVAVVGAGPAGLACAHRLASFGHNVTIFDAREKSGGLNEYGIAAYKTVQDFAQAEVDYVTAIGGISIKHGKRLGDEIELAALRKDFDAVFIGAGLGDSNDLGIDGQELAGVVDAIDFIADLRQAGDMATIPVGRRVVVIGGGMTAIDAAIQSKLLGAEDVTICYRRGQDRMNASALEQELAAAKGVTIRHWLQPVAVRGDNGAANQIELEYTAHENGKLAGTGRKLVLAADQVLVAIGQKLAGASFADGGPAMAKDRIRIDAEGRTSLENVWAGGDCVNGGDDLTVFAVAQGRDAAESMHQTLSE